MINLFKLREVLKLSCLQVQNNDALPKCLCRDCCWIVEKSFIFRMVAKQSDSRLRKHIRLLNQNKPSNLLNKDYEDDESLEFAEICTESFVSCDNLASIEQNQISVILEIF